MNPPITTILMLSANPQGSSAQRLDQEKRDIYEGLQRSRWRDRFRLETHSAARPRDLQRAMLDLNPQIVHFSGQGEAEAGLVFEDAIGQPQLIDAEALAALFELFADRLQCVVLNACYSEAQAEAIAQHIPYVVGMSAAIDDRAAIEFAVGFYDALGAGKDFEFAYQFGRSAARLHGTADWMPVLKTQPNAAPRQAVTIVPPSSQPFSPAIYSASTWVERSEITAPLLQILQGNCRVLALTGITGIGKTALAERLISELRDQKRFCRLNLDEGSVSAEFSGSGAALLRSLGEEPTLEDQKDPQNLLAHLLQLLRSHPYQVQMDSMEKLLEGDDRQGWSEFCDPLWLDLLQQVLAGQDCQSQLILTTQDLPAGLEAIGSRYPQFWHCQAVRGLSEVEQLELFAKRGLSEGQTDYLKRIGKLYDGHPLVLRVIAEDIKACGGNVQRYWQQGKFAEQEADRPAQLSRRKLQLEVKQRVQEALARLPEDALQLLCRSAVYRRPVPEAFWLAMLPERSHPETALELLKARALAEEDWEEGTWLGVDGAIPLRQHNLIRSVAYECLKADAAAWQAAERTAAEQWLNQYEAVPEAENLEKVRGYLEAFEHFCEVEDWNLANKVIEMDFNVFDLRSSEGKRSLLQWLDLSGYYQEVIKILCRISNKLSPHKNSHSLQLLGRLSYELGNYSQALKYCHLSLEESDRVYKHTIETFETIGDVKMRLGDYNASLAAYELSLKTINTIDSNLGSYEISLVNKSVRCKIVNLSIREFELDQNNRGLARKILNSLIEIARDNDRKSSENTNDNSCLETIDECIQELQELSNVSKFIGLRSMEISTLQTLESLYNLNHQCYESTNVLQRLLKTFKEVGKRGDEADTYRKLAELHQQMGEIELAQEYCDRALAIAIELGIPLVKDCEILKQQLEEENNASDR